MVFNCFTLHVPHHPTTPFLTSKNPKPSHSSIHLSFPSNFIKDFHAPYNSLAKYLPMKCSNSSIPIASPDFEFEPDPTLTNEDLKPTAPSQRTFSGLEMASLWVGLVVGVPFLLPAGSLVDLGMAWWQGTRYGISFPVLARSSFGIHGAHIPTLLRALVGCGWYGIESWIGGEAIFLLLPNQSKKLHCPTISLGLELMEFDSLRSTQLQYSLSLLPGPLIWSYVKAGGFSHMLSLSSRLSTSEFDMPRARMIKLLVKLGFPSLWGLFTFVGLAVTSSTKVIFGQHPANALVNLNPKWFTFRRGALLTALLGIVFQPWRLLKSRGFNVAAIMALVFGILPVVPGFLQKVGIVTSVPDTFVVIYNNAWFISFFSAGFLYWILSSLRRKPGKYAAGDPLLPATK
ncbi:Purine-cytosine permease [Sesbania bispinosa]|nr:Purine-cytosine permease [Sesbania bispinosa]